jgi:hypothetical protein
MTSQRDRVIAQLRKRQEEKLLKKESDSLKAKRTYAEELEKTQPEYKATKAKETEAKRINADTNLKKAKKEAKGPTPQEDMLRFGQQQKKFRDLAYKERVLTETDEKGTEDKSDDETTVSMQYIPREGGEIFKQQVEAYGDSLKLAELAQQYGRRTPDIRKIDRNQKEIEKERTRIAGEKWKQLITQKLPLRPGADGTYSEVTDKEKFEMANDIANEELVKKYGKGIIPLLTALKNR